MAKHVFCFTGSPVLNTPLDLFTQMRVINKDLFGSNFYAFRRKYFYDEFGSARAKVPGFRAQRWVPKPGAVEELSRIIGPWSYTVKKEDCLDLPPLTRVKHYVQMSRKQEQLYREMEKQSRTFLQGEELTAAIALSRCLRLAQIASGIFQVDGNTYHHLETPKLPALWELLDTLFEAKPSRKVIIWSAFRPPIERITEEIGKRKFGEEKRGVCNVIGGQSTNERNNAVTQFVNNDDTQILVASQGAGGTGLNLQVADTAIYFARDYNLGHDIQSEARNHRGGSEQHSKVTRIDLITENTVDEVMAYALEKKMDTAQFIAEIQRIYQEAA